MPSLPSIGPNNGAAPVVEVKSVDWVFNSLWYAVGKERGGGGGSIIINIPDTVLFIGGEPSKWLGTNSSGRICRYCHCLRSLPST
jgi:hypothetical protein